MSKSNLLSKIVRTSSHFLSPVLRALGSVVFQTKRAHNGDFPIVFIIGAPRTGSTFLYQALTNFADVSYIDNLACKFRDALFFGVYISHLLFGRNQHNNFNSDHGSTSKFGLHCPSECGEFWYRWFPRDPHFVEADALSATKLTGLAKELSQISKFFRRPVVIKNLVCSQRLRVLAQVFPDAKVIVVTRDSEEVLSSILKARKARSVPPSMWWSVKPRSYELYVGLQEQEMVRSQISLISEVISEDVHLFSPSNVRFVDYTEINKDLVLDISCWIGASIKSVPSDDVFKGDRRVVKDMPGWRS